MTRSASSAARAAAHSLLAALVALLLLGCDEKNGRGDGGDEWDGGGGGTCTSIDKVTSWKNAETLAEGQEVTGTICPAKDQDYFKVTVPEGKRLLHLKLMNTVETTNVQLTYLILRVTGEKEDTVGQAPAWSGVGIRTFDDYHCLEPGTYFILVKDDGDDGRDGNNPYKISYTTEGDKDGNEPNNDPATAKQPGSGAISCKGDLDFFTVNGSELLEVKLTTAAATRVDLKYTIYDENKKVIGEASTPDGSKGPTSLSVIHALPKAGKYIIAVEDLGGDDSDPAATYTLAVTDRAEPDANDKGGRNDTVATATVLGSFGGGSATYTKSGQIASKADLDYYKIDGLAGISPDNPAVIEVTVDYGGPSDVDPQVALIYPHSASPCSKDTCCTVLKASCNSEFDCLRETFSCIKKGDIFCADNECAPQATTSCPTEMSCAGAVACLPEGVCGAEQVSRQDDNGTDGAIVRTAQPLLHPGPWYIRVSDLKSDEYEYGKGYTLTVKVRMDPDGAKELNSEYFPTLVATAIKTRDYHTAAAKKKAVKIVPGTPMTGTISYEGDQDWYIFDHPCPGQDCTFTVSYTASGNCPGGTKGSGLEFVYILHKSSGDPWFAFPSNPTAGQSGSYGPPGECLYAFNKHSNAYFFSVSDLDHNNWSWDCSYTVTISAPSIGCNSPCILKGNNNECSTP